MESSPKTRPLAQCTAEDVAAAVGSFGPNYADYAKKIIEQGIDGTCIVDMLESGNADDLIQSLGVPLIVHQKRLKKLFNDLHTDSRAAAADRFPAPVHDDAVELGRVHWLKALLILKACTKGIRPFVGQVMQRLHSQVIDNVISDVVRDLGACEKAEWDCSACDDIDDVMLTENSPVSLTIRTMDSNGIADCGLPHYLKPHALRPCHLKNVPPAFFPDCDGMSPLLPLLMCPNPAHIDPKSSTFLLLHGLQPPPTQPHLTPFFVMRYEPSEPALQFHAVLCDSRPGHTAPLVNAIRSGREPPSVRVKHGESSFAFWSLQCQNSKHEFSEVKHGVKIGHILCFDGELPPGIQPLRRYLVTDAKAFSFNICGPILTPTLPLTAESFHRDDDDDGAPLVVIRRSPIGRLRDAARLFHSRGIQSQVHWSGIRADRLSSHHGEFCKLFCSRTSRDIDFFSKDWANSGGGQELQSIEDLFNMIIYCTAFSMGNQFDSNNLLPIGVKQGSPSKPFNCVVHSLPPVVLSVVASSNYPSDPSARNFAKAQPIKLWIGSMNEVGFWSCDEHMLVADTMVSFSDAGCGLPLNIHAGCRYQPTCIEAGSFQLLRPNFCSLFNVDRSDLNNVKLALEKVQKGATGLRDFRNMMFHNLLTLETCQFEASVACARTIFEGVCSAHQFVFPNDEDSNCAELRESLAEIDRLVEREMGFQGLISTLTDHETDVVAREHERMLEENDRLRGNTLCRKIDSVAICLKEQIEDQLVKHNRIGGGVYSSVYRVKHWLWGQPLAVKVFDNDSSAWRRELNSLMILEHPNIVRLMYIVYETLDDRRQCRAPTGCVMELMALSADDPREFTRAQLLSVFVQIASALVFCHERGVVHFDVKPANILLDETCSVAKLANFGCSRLLQSEDWGENQVCGTVLYMPFEQFHADFESDPKLCDIYSFGKTMWKLLHPTCDVKINRAFPVAEDVPLELKELVEQCTMDDPAERPQNMTIVYKRLQLLLFSLEDVDGPEGPHFTTEDPEQLQVSASQGSSAALGRIFERSDIHMQQFNRRRKKNMFSERVYVHKHEQFDRHHDMLNGVESLVLWSKTGNAHLQKSVLYTMNYTHSFKFGFFDSGGSSKVVLASIEQFYDRLYQKLFLDPVLFVPYTYYSDIRVARESDLDCELSCFFEIQQEYSDMHSLDDLLVLAQDGSASRPCFPESALRYVALTIIKALASLRQEVEVFPGRKVVFEYSMLNPSTIMCSSDGCVKLAAPFFPPQSDWLDRNRFCAETNVVRGREPGSTDRDYSSPDERLVSKDAWALAVTLIELRTGIPFKFKSPFAHDEANTAAITPSTSNIISHSQFLAAMKVFDNCSSIRGILFIAAFSTTGVYLVLSENEGVYREIPLTEFTAYIVSYNHPSLSKKLLQSLTPVFTSPTFRILDVDIREESSAPLVLTQKHLTYQELPKQADGEKNSSLLWDEMFQTLTVAGREDTGFSKHLMHFLQSLICSRHPLSTLQDHPWLTAPVPMSNPSGWFQGICTRVKPWLNQESLLNYVKNRFCSRGTVLQAKVDDDIDMSNVCNINDVNSAAWADRKDPSFPLIPPEIINMAERNNSFQPIHAFLQDLSAFGKEPLSFVRIMMVGMGEVGKTRLVKALNSREGYSSEEISRPNRTVAAEVSEFELEGGVDAGSRLRTLTACVWDFAGQAEYYMTHSLFFSERAIYMLVWKRPSQQQSCILEDEREGIKKWLHMLAAAVPNARIVVVGTHRETTRAGESAAEYSKCYKEIAGQVHQIVKEECDSINQTIKRGEKSASNSGMEVVHTADVDSCTGFGVKDLKLQLHALALTMPFVDIEVPSSYNVIEQSIRRFIGGFDSADDDGNHDDDDAHFEPILSRAEFLQRFRKFQNEMLLKRYTQRKAEGHSQSKGTNNSMMAMRVNLLDAIEDMDGESSEPDTGTRADVSVKDLDFQSSVQSQAAFQESVSVVVAASDSVVVAEQLQAQAFVPADQESIVSVAEEIQAQLSVLAEHAKQEVVGALRVEKESIDGAMLLDEDIWKGVEFWHLLGIVYVQKGSNFVVIKPQCIVDFLKPLVHREPEMMLTADRTRDPNNDLLDKDVVEQCQDSKFKLDVLKVLGRLKKGLIFASDLKRFRFWSALSKQKTDFMVEFLQNHHVLQRNVLDPDQLHVISRAHSNEIPVSDFKQFSGSYQAFYIINEMHVDFLSRVQAFLLGRQRFSIMELSCGRNGGTVASKFSQGNRRGEVRMQTIQLSDIKQLFGETAETIVADYSFMIIVSATDFGFFSLGVNCAELFMSAHAMFFPCWIKNSAGKVYDIDAQHHALSLYFRPPRVVKDGGPCLSSLITEAFADNPEISEELFCNIWERISEFCICHCSEGDGTNLFKEKFIEFFEMLCTCSCTVLDQNNTIDQELVNCFRSAKAIIFLLNPAFICSVECMAKLQLALHLCVHIVVIPLYPSLSHFSRERIFQTRTICCHHAQADGRPQFFKLSDQCISCLELIHHSESQNYDHWLKLRPWMSDTSPDWKTHGAYVSISNFDSDTDSHTAIAMFASSGSRNSKFALMNVLCEELSNLFNPVQSSKEPVSPKQVSLLSIASALPVDPPSFENSRRVFAEKSRRPGYFMNFLNELMVVGLNDQDIIHNCQRVQRNDISGGNHRQTDSVCLSAYPILLSPDYLSDAFRQIAKKFKIGLDEISRLPIEILFERSESSSTKSADTTRSLASDSSSSFELSSLSSSSRSSGSAQNLRSNGSLDAIKAHCVITFKGMFPDYATEDNLKIISDKITNLDETSLFLLTEPFLRPLENRCGLAFVDCVREVRRQARPSLCDVRLEQIRSIVEKWGMVLGEELGHGGFGKVYKCSLPHPAKSQYCSDTHVAVKVVRYNVSKPARFRKEVEALRKLGDHPNIVRIFDVYPDFDVADSSITDVAAYSMQLLPSGDFRKLIEHPPNGPFISQDAFLSIAKQLLGALMFIHSNGNFHGDIKPENILWKLRQGTGSVFLFENVHILLSDFGLVKTHDIQDSSSFSASTPYRVEGSLHYRSPEQRNAPGAYTVSDDTWSAALVLAELMCRTNINEVQGYFKLKVLYRRCPAHLSRFIPVIHAALRKAKTERIISPLVLLDCLKQTYYDVAILYQPNSQNVDRGIALHLNGLLVKKGYRPYVCKIGEIWWQKWPTLLYDATEVCAPAFEEVFAKLYFDVMTAMKSWVVREKRGQVSRSSGTFFDEKNDFHRKFREQIENRIQAGQTGCCSIEVNTNMDILTNGLDLFCRCGNTVGDSELLQRRSCAFEMAKACTGKVDGDHEKAKGIVRFQDLDALGRLKICANLLLFPDDARKAARRLVNLRNTYLGHTKTPELSLKEYFEVKKCIDDLFTAFGRNNSADNRTPSDILRDGCDIDIICRSTFMIPILSDNLLLSWTKPEKQSHHKESDVLLAQCKVAVECLSEKEADRTFDREHPYAWASLQKARPIFIQRSPPSRSFMSSSQKEKAMKSMAQECMDKPYVSKIGIETVLGHFTQNIRDARFFIESCNNTDLCLEIEDSLRQEMKARFQPQSDFCVEICDKKAKRVCPIGSGAPDVIELSVVQIRGMNLKCGDHLRNQNEDYIGQVIQVSAKGHDDKSRPKFLLTVSCIREACLSQGDLLFPVFCDQQNNTDAAKENDGSFIDFLKKEISQRIEHSQVCGKEASSSQKKFEGIANCLLRKLQQKNKSNPPKLNDDEQKFLDEMREKYTKTCQSPANDSSSHALNKSGILKVGSAIAAFGVAAITVYWFFQRRKK